MKKSVLIIVLCLSLMSCKKDRQCYHCIIASFGTRPSYETDYCGDDGGARKFKDADGNDLSSWCQPK